MSRIGDGDHRALAILLERYWSPLVGFAGGIVGAQDRAKDVVQDAFVRIWQRRQDWSPTGSAKAYVYRIVRNLSLNERRNRKTAELRHREMTDVRARPRTPAQELDARQVRAEVESAIAALPDRRREIFILSRFDGLSHREIADVLEISPQTVANQMTAALSELRAVLRHLFEGD